MAITAFALFLAIPLWAQRGGGGHGGFGGGGHGGFGGRAGGFGGHASFGGAHFGGAHSFGGARSFGGMRGGPGYSRGFSRYPSRNGFSHSPYLHNGFRNGFNNNGFRNGFHNRFGGRGRFHDRDWAFRNGCWGGNCWGYGGWGYPWWGWGYDPWLWGDWDSEDTAFDNAYQQDIANANQMNEQSLEEQRMRRQEEVDGDQDLYADQGAYPDQGAYGDQGYVRPPYRPSYQPPQSQSSAPRNDPAATAIIPATVLVFRDQKTEEVKNYAIVGQTLWNFGPHRTEKVPLSELDLAATTKANDDRGVTFTVPNDGEGQ